ncbi:MAG TPA: regulatory protein RecX [Bacteroidales bacterium]|mgnify:CR=1 FL=1|jgi:regulatory protein|nr:RecX family transcriptional regulator [Bacteroidota bacterium]HJN05781.1 regulatory protein RecX [Bacteroidales bacterium]|tara:strand:+ start:1055 stop:1507 length:453 start_codon:yes stop_codon:yes gene_type:complete
MAPEHTFLLNKARKFCAYQERSIFDLKSKLLSWNVSEKIIAEIILLLKKEDFINEERFTFAFATGKLRNNKWGKNKIGYALRQKQIPELTIQIALNSLDEDEYIKTLKAILSSKNIDDDNDFRRNSKLVKYAQQKGFQPDLVWKVIKNEI